MRLQELHEADDQRILRGLRNREMKGDVRGERLLEAALVRLHLLQAAEHRLQVAGPAPLRGERRSLHLDTHAQLEDVSQRALRSFRRSEPERTRFGVVLDEYAFALMRGDQAVRLQP